MQVKPYEDPNTLIEQSASLNYSNSTFIVGSPLDMPLAWLKNNIEVKSVIVSSLVVSTSAVTLANSEGVFVRDLCNMSIRNLHSFL